MAFLKSAKRDPNRVKMVIFSEKLQIRVAACGFGLRWLGVLSQTPVYGIFKLSQFPQL